LMTDQGRHVLKAAHIQDRL